MPRCSRKSRSDRWFSSDENSALGTKSVPRTVPILPDFETVPKPSRNRPETVPKPSRNRPETLFFVLLLFAVCCLFFVLWLFAFCFLRDARARQPVCVHWLGVGLWRGVGG